MDHCGDIPRINIRIRRGGPYQKYGFLWENLTINKLILGEIPTINKLIRGLPRINLTIRGDQI